MIHNFLQKQLQRDPFTTCDVFPHLLKEAWNLFVILKSEIYNNYKLL